MNNLFIHALLVALVVYLSYYIIKYKVKENYKVYRGEYAYGAVDTNPNRRRAGFFDQCSPENFGDCKRFNNQFEGLPLP
jgi:hypothetical protein